MSEKKIFPESTPYPNDYGVYEKVRNKLQELDCKNDMGLGEFANEILKIWNEEGLIQGEWSCNLPLSGGTGD